MNAARSLIFFLSVAAPKLGMFVVLFTLARLLPVAEVGLFVLVITVGELLEMVAVQWVRIFVQNREAGRDRVSSLRAGRLIAVTVSVTLIAVAISIPTSMVVADDRWVEFAVATGLYIIAFGVLRYALGILQTLRRHADYGRIEAARFATILAMIAFVAAVEHPTTFLAPSLTLSCGTLLVGLWGIVLTASSINRPRFTRLGLKAAALFGAPMIGDALLSYLVVSFDRLVLNEVSGAAAVGIYGIAYALARQPIEFVAGPLNNISVPALFAANASRGPDAARKMQTGICLTLFIVCAGMVAGIFGLRHQIVQIFLKPEFWPDTVWLMPVITIAGCLIFFKMYLFDNVYHLYGRTALKLKMNLPVALVSLALTAGLIYAYGLVGTAVALIVSSILSLAGSVFGTRSFFAFPLPFADMAKVTAIALCALAALFGATWLARSYGLWAELAAGFAAFCAIYGVGLVAIGISLRNVLAAPWAPKRVHP